MSVGIVRASEDSCNNAGGDELDSYEAQYHTQAAVA